MFVTWHTVHTHSGLCNLARLLYVRPETFRPYYVLLGVKSFERMEHFQVNLKKHTHKIVSHNFILGIDISAMTRIDIWISTKKHAQEPHARSSLPHNDATKIQVFCN